MQNPSADERRIRDLVEVQIMRESKHQGPKPNAEKIVQILTLISRNTRRHQPPHTRKEIVNLIPDMKENVIEDYLGFLQKFPPSRPFLKVERQKRPEKKKHSPGAPPNAYVFDLYWLLDSPNPRLLKADMLLAESMPQSLSASIVLVPDTEEPPAE